MAQKNTLLICVLVAVLSTVYCSKTKSSKECKENGCGEPTHIWRNATIDGCTGELCYGSCEGWCNMKSFYDADDNDYYTDTTCCRPGCFEEFTANLMCGDGSSMLYKYHVPRHCECDGCLGSDSHQNLAGSLLGATCENNLRVFFDGVLQMSYSGNPAGYGNMDDPERATHYNLDRYRNDRCNRPRNITLECEDGSDSKAGMMASDRQGLTTCDDWMCERDGVPMNTTVMGINGAVSPWSYVPWIAPNANWIYPGDPEAVTGEGPVAQCTTYLE